MPETMQQSEAQVTTKPVSADFSIVELEDRLEFAEVCDHNCCCTCVDAAPKPAG